MSDSKQEQINTSNNNNNNNSSSQQNNQNTTITFADQSAPTSQANHEKINQRSLTRSSTGQSSISFDARSVRSVLMKKVNLVKRRKARKTEEQRVEGPPYHTMDLETVAKLMKSDLEDGLDQKEVDARREESGFNEMEGEGGVNPFKLLLKQFFNIMVLILLVAMVVSFVFEDWVEGAVICAIMFLNAGVGFAQEYKAEKTMDSLRQMASPTSQVVRDGQSKTIPTRELIPGDVIILKAGDVVGADCRVIESFNMDIDEALLTGESVPVNKVIDTLEGSEIPLGDRVNMTYSSTVLTKGRGKAIVTATGMQTEIGKIALRLLNSDDSRKTPLQRSLDRMALVLLVVAIISVIIVFAVAKFNIEKGQILYAISTAISAIPEALVAVVTLTQAFGVHSMAKANALVRKISALELLGSVTNVCSDKTGTLTQSKMVLTRLWRPDEGFFKVGGLGFSIEGDFTRESDDKVMTKDGFTSGLHQLALTGALCNMSELRKDKETGDYHGMGDPTEVALQVFAHKVQMGKPSLTKSEKGENWKLIAEYPFDSSIKRMSILAQAPDGSYYAFIKGATERVLGTCAGVQYSEEDEIKSMQGSELEELVLPQVEELAKGGLRVLSLGIRKVKAEGPVGPETFKREEIEQGMNFLGLVGIYDPPRAESKEAVEQCHLAGITVHMLTGDHAATATAIAREVSILPERYGLDGKPQEELVMTATKFDKLTEEQVDALPQLPLVIARCSPDTKVKMIEALHRRKRIAGMTGDGVNDSPSLKEADIGIAMGQNGSDVAKQAADIVLVDDNFATIVKAIEEGRRVFANISRFVVHMVTGNIAEVVPLIIGLCFIKDGESVFLMTPLQILFNNILTSSPPAMSLGLEPVHPDQMLVPPRPTSEGLFAWPNVLDIIFYGSVIGIICLLNFIVVIYGWGNGHESLGTDCNGEYNDTCEVVFRARGAVFAALTIMVLLHGFTCRDLLNPIWTWKGLVKRRQNYYLLWSTVGCMCLMFIALYVPVLDTVVFKHKGISWEWGMVFASCFIYMAITEIWKYFKRISHRRKLARRQQTEQAEHDEKAGRLSSE
ncbi:potassium/sodium efflux P-type ATPase [Zychaea mexicana]|uniref:potassium/sodium efflux P-type ATPase n=1 Tax=Zychaea mexicana TaxID=64656 RepID=UPI0022FEA137|nr:potassium/sodium efflux P-type ATPase [Zychaea mexicana]KAI9490870.1 potassium/sodium efflux P-type ATPase [Zychaea mexicana]